MPWEARRELGLPRAFARTLWLSIREPTRFYGLVTRDAPALPAVAYALVLEVVVASITFAYDATAGAKAFREEIAALRPRLEEAVPGAADLLLRVHEKSAIASLLLSPVSCVVELLATAGMTWAGMRLVRCPRPSFRVLFVALAYASWVRVFATIGITGDLVLGSLSFVLGVGFGSYAWVAVVRRTHGIDATQAVYVSLAGLAVGAVAALVLAAPLIAAAIVWAASSFDLPNQ